jgi:hypothetical protein
MKQIKFFRSTGKVLVYGKIEATLLAQFGKVIVAGVATSGTIYTNAANLDDFRAFLEKRAMQDFAGVMLLTVVNRSKLVQASIEIEGDKAFVNGSVEGEMLMITRDGRFGVFGCNGQLYSNDPERAKAEVKEDMEVGVLRRCLMTAINLCGLEKAEVEFIGEEGE